MSEAGDEKREGPLKKYHVAKPFADRRYKVSSARTYFYLNEASCERNMDIFIRCLESVAGESIIQVDILKLFFFFLPYCDIILYVTSRSVFLPLLNAINENERYKSKRKRESIGNI